MLCLAKEAVFMGAETRHCALRCMTGGTKEECLKSVMVLLVEICSPADLH